MSNNPKVLIIYTGGTIGMINDPKTGALKPFKFDNLYKTIPELIQFDYQLDVDSIEQPIDSSEMNIDVWKKIATTVFDKYEIYDGFVILHGSDTMAYTASALSFMLQGLKKPVILTGSQLPIGQIRTDGKENLITAIEIAGLKDLNNESIVQEVAIYFEYSLYRGNRASKISANHFEAFESPNYEPLAIAGVDIDFNEHDLYRTTKQSLEIFTGFDNKVASLKLFPSMSIETIALCFNNDLFDAIVIETYGSGNSFSTPKFKELLNDYINKGGIVVNTTQCIKGKVVQGKYQTSDMFADAGAISAIDQTFESTITKTMYALGKSDNINDRKTILKQNICGEITSWTS
jgi:L-asparaginase